MELQWEFMTFLHKALWGPSQESNVIFSQESHCHFCLSTAACKDTASLYNVSKWASARWGNTFLFWLWYKYKTYKHFLIQNPLPLGQRWTRRAICFSRYRWQNPFRVTLISASKQARGNTLTFWIRIFFSTCKLSSSERGIKRCTNRSTCFSRGFKTAKLWKSTDTFYFSWLVCP